jgi:hypothetical protein
VDEVCKLAVQAGYRRADKWIAEKRAEQWPCRDWEDGACIWCEVDEGKRRKATCLDLGGGPAMCDRHFDEMYEDPAPAVSGQEGDDER